MSLLSDLKTLWHLALAPAGGATHAERMERFYRGQSAGYDDFRARLLHGRRELMNLVAPVDGSVWVDLGGGTGANLELVDRSLRAFRQVYLVDLAPSLLRIADRRAACLGWNNVRTIQADAKHFSPPEPVDLVTFSYSLTMIPDWFAALERAWQILRPGGQIGVVDFYVSRKHSVPGRAQHRWFTRNLLPIWFGTDNVFLNADHLPFLESRFETIQLQEHLGTIPYLPMIRAPFYLFLGRKPA
ncbi:MAG: class I SAM-dependent methyltransferase [Planctomycetales bacterium]